MISLEQGSIFRSINYAYNSLKKVRQLTNSGLDASVKDVYLTLEGAAYTLAGLPTNYSLKFKIYEKFQSLIYFKDVGKQIITFNYLIETPPFSEKHNWRDYRNVAAEKDLEDYLNRLRTFIRTELDKSIEAFEKILDGLVLIDAKPIAADAIDENTFLTLKILLLKKLKSMEIRGLRLEDYGKEFEPGAFYSSLLSDQPIEVEATERFGSIEKSRILEIISDYDLWDVVSIKISLKNSSES